MVVNDKWKLSPAYDLTYSEGWGLHNNEHSITIGGESLNPEENHIKIVADKAGISKKTYTETLEQVAESAIEWKEEAKNLNIDKKRIEYIDRKIQKMLKIIKVNGT